MSYHSPLLQTTSDSIFRWHENWRACTRHMPQSLHWQRRISSIRHLLSIDATKKLLSAFVLPKLDYCYSPFNGSPMYMLERLQNFQDLAARLIFQCRQKNRISPLLMSLHWLPINARIEYKLSVFCHSFFLGSSPIYLSNFLLVHTPKRNLHSSSVNRIICIPKLRTRTYGHRAFSFAGHTIWNSLPSKLRHTHSIQKFMLALKTLLVWKFNTWCIKFFVDLDFNHYIWSTCTCVRMRDCESLTCENYYFIYTF